MQPGGWDPSGGAPPQGGYPPQQGYGAQQPHQPPPPPPQQQQQGFGAPQQGFGAPQPGFGAPQMPSAAQASAAGAGFLKSLLDFSFTSFITAKVVKVIYAIMLLGVPLILLGGFYEAINQWFLRYRSDFVQGVIVLVLTPLVAAAYLVLIRIYCELLVVMIRIAENLAEINSKIKPRD
jgi:hypothetical protein